MRILLLQNVINPHMMPVFTAMANAPGVDLEVVYFAESEADRTWASESDHNFRSTVLPGRELSLFMRWDTLSVHINPGLGRYLRDARPDVVINAGWGSITNWHAFASCRRRRIPMVLWAGSTRHEPSWRRTLTRAPVRHLVRHSDAWASYGTASAAYLVDLGAPPERVVPAFHCVDNARFLSRCQTLLPRVAAERAALELGDRPVVLFVGRMLERKGAHHLIEAVAALRQGGRDVALLLVGEGPMRASWEQQARTLLPGAVRFVGNKPLEQLPLYYQLADVFALPSLEEVWGLVVNEAALASLPLIVSESCGAAPDLVEPGVNGFRVPPGDVPALQAALDKVLAEPAAAARMGRESRRLVEQRCTPEKVAASLLRAAELAHAARAS